MRRPELDPYMSRITNLASEMQKHIPASATKMGVVDFRADLAGLLTVTIIASYESCVKATLLKFASKHHVKFADYVSSSYEQLNSRIRVNDLKNYCKDFDGTARTKFDTFFKNRKDTINKAIGQNIESAYSQMLDWRHEFAHSAQRKTTIEEALKQHGYARHVLFAFYDSFHK